MAVLLDLTRCDRNLSYTFIVSICVRLGGRSAPFADRHYIKSSSSIMCFIFAKTRTTPEDFRSIKQKNEKEENGSWTKKFLDGGVSLRCSDELQLTAFENQGM